MLTTRSHCLIPHNKVSSVFLNLCEVYVRNISSQMPQRCSPAAQVLIEVFSSGKKSRRPRHSALLLRCITHLLHPPTQDRAIIRVVKPRITSSVQEQVGGFGVCFGRRPMPFACC